MKRRNFIKKASAAIIGGALVPPLLAQQKPVPVEDSEPTGFLGYYEPVLAEFDIESITLDNGSIFLHVIQPVIVRVNDIIHLRTKDGQLSIDVCVVVPEHYESTNPYDILRIQRNTGDLLYSPSIKVNSIGIRCIPLVDIVPDEFIKSVELARKGDVAFTGFVVSNMYPYNDDFSIRYVDPIRRYPLTYDEAFPTPE